MEQTKERQTLTSDAVLTRLRGLVGYGRSQADLAREMEVTTQYVSLILKGERSAPDTMLTMAGVERRVEYYLTA